MPKHQHTTTNNNVCKSVQVNIVLTHSLWLICKVKECQQHPVLDVQACYAAREAEGIQGHFQMDPPINPERLRLACPDHLTKPHFAADAMPPISC